MSVTFPRGFLASGVACGLKDGVKRDLALVVNTGPEAMLAGVTTTNRVFAAPVAYTRGVLARQHARAVLLNSGGANACTGKEGAADVLACVQEVTKHVGICGEDIAVCSTGLIGERLNLDAMSKGIALAASELSAEGGLNAAEAIITTDTHSKVAQRTGANYRIGGMAKGAGMLAPALATMLVVITTDARLSAEQAQAAIEHGVEYSFNRIDSDGCMSTNDTVLLMANGQAEPGEGVDLQAFTEDLTAVCQDLAAQLIGDAEGASHDISICVHGATSEAAGLAVARAVGRSNLLKAAIFGNDPNWGRVLASLGTVPEEVAPFDADKLDVSINGVMVCKNGGLGEARSKVSMAERLVTIDIYLKAGEAEAQLLTNDLTYDYVTENSAYSS